MRLLAPAALFALALAVRVLPARGVFLDGRTIPFGNDAYYHLRRVVYSVSHFPRVLDFDPYINFPDGARPIWSPAFDWLTALLVLPFSAGGDAARIEALAMWVPPLLGAAAVVALYALARRYFGATRAVLAGALLALSSGHFWYSQIGFLDHHAAVALCSTLLLAVAMAAVDARAGPAAGPALGAALAVALLVWPGSLLHVGLVEVGLLAHLLTRPDREAAIACARRLALAHALACLAVAPFGLGQAWPQWSRFSPLVLSAFQPGLLAALAVFAGVCALVWRTRALDAPGRALAALAVGSGLLGTALLLLPELAEGQREAWLWLTKSDGFQRLVAESQPLFGPGFDARVAEIRLSHFVYVFPVAWAACALSAWRTPDRAPRLLLLGWVAGLLVATLVQKRFFNSLTPAWALLMAWSAGLVWRLLPAGWRVGSRRGVAATLGLVALLLLLLPGLARYAPHIGNQIRGLSGQPIRADPRATGRYARVDLALWLAHNTPVTSGWLDPQRRPEYGVLAPWGMGHVIEYVARRPTVMDNFGDDLGAENFARARAYYLVGEPRAARILEQLSARYVVASPDPGFLGATPGPTSMFRALSHGDGAGLRRHRLIYAPGDARTGLRVYEFVEGARVVGRAVPGRELRVRLELETHRRRRLSYATTARADASGRYELRLPYATRGGSPAVRVAGPYALFCDGQRAELHVDEASVRAGARIPGPPLCGAGEAGAAEPDPAPAAPNIPRDVTL